MVSYIDIMSVGEKPKYTVKWQADLKNKEFMAALSEILSAVKSKFWVPYRSMSVKNNYYSHILS